MVHEKLTLLVFLSLFLCSYGAPIEDDFENDNLYRKSLENPNLFGGDILLTKKNRFARRHSYYRWNQRTIPYIIAQNRTNLKFQIQKAMRHIENKTCIRFVPHTIEKDNVFIFHGNGCYSSVGRIGGRQYLSLGKGCESLGTITHELMHAIGFWHQHQRYDRDQYLNINWENIKPEHIHNFNLLKSPNSLVYTPFDYKSIMLYYSYAFSKDGRSKTMTPKDPKIVLLPTWRKMNLSDSDVISINKLYGCK